MAILKLKTLVVTWVGLILPFVFGLTGGLFLRLYIFSIVVILYLLSWHLLLQHHFKEKTVHLDMGKNLKICSGQTETNIKIYIWNLAAAVFFRQSI